MGGFSQTTQFQTRHLARSPNSMTSIYFTNWKPNSFPQRKRGDRSCFHRTSSLRSTTGRTPFASRDWRRYGPYPFTRLGRKMLPSLSWSSLCTIFPLDRYCGAQEKDDVQNLPEPGDIGHVHVGLIDAKAKKDGHHTCCNAAERHQPHKDDK